MKQGLIIAGVILIILAVVGLSMGGFSITEKRDLVKIGDFKITGTEERHYPIPPIVNYALLLGGAAMIVGGSMAAAKAA